MSTAAAGKPYYFVPQPSHWPIIVACVTRTATALERRHRASG
jgi:hypothetical protein